MSRYRKVFPAIGLVHFPFFAALISAYKAGLIPFFLHFLISASVSVLMSKLLALQVLLPLDFEPERLLSTLPSMDWRDLCSSGREVVDLADRDVCDIVDGFDFRSIDVDFSMTRRVGLGGGS
jgi:hypothetical protein